MHFYMFNPADFNNSARHLSLPERAIYRDLIDMYYHSEQAIDTSDIDRLARRLLCTSAEYRASLEYVLDEFFVKRGKRHHHHRIDREIKNYKFKNSHTNVTQAVTPSHTHVTSDVTQGHANIDVTMTAAERQRKSRQDKRKMIDDLTNIGVSVDSSIKLTDLRELHASH
ncbi:YdaU family protein, partial [Psychrobacter sp. AOP7-A1-24]